MKELFLYIKGFAITLIFLLAGIYDLVVFMICEWYDAVKIPFMRKRQKRIRNERD